MKKHDTGEEVVVPPRFLGRVLEPAFSETPRETLARAIGALKARGYTIILVEQNLRFAAPLADRMYVLEIGQVALEASQSQYQARRAEIEALLEV